MPSNLTKEEVESSLVNPISFAQGRFLVTLIMLSIFVSSLLDWDFLTFVVGKIIIWFKLKTKQFSLTYNST